MIHSLRQQTTEKTLMGLTMFYDLTVSSCYIHLLYLSTLINETDMN